MGVKNKEFEIIERSIHDDRIRTCALKFLENVSFNEKYKNVVQEFKNNKEQIKMSNLLKEVRSNGKNNKRKRK